jgi:hypothetical protein
MTEEWPTPAEFREKARQHRERAMRENDGEHRKALLMVAEEYDKLAAEMEHLRPRRH